MSGTYQAPEGWVGTLCTYDRDDDTHIATARAPARLFPTPATPTPSSRWTGGWLRLPALLL